MRRCNGGCGYTVNVCVCVCVRARTRDALGSLKVVRKKVFVDERWSQNRNVTAIDWSSYVSHTSFHGYFY